MKAILVTGANSGIGYLISKKLHQEGYHIFGCSRSEKNFDVFTEMDNVTPILLDVTNQETIDKAKDIIKDSEHQLKGLVNNAGTAILAPLIQTPVENISSVFDVNLLGVHRMILAFSDEIIHNKGRIVNISSISGILSGFAYGNYALSKHALEGYSDTLAAEMEKFGVKVSIIEPGGYDTKIVRRLFDDTMTVLDNIPDNPYQDEIDDWKRRAASLPHGMSQLPTAEAVADAVHHAVSSKTPKSRYMVTSLPIESEMTIKGIINEMLQLNQDHQHSLSLKDLLDVVQEEYTKLQQIK